MPNVLDFFNYLPFSFLNYMLIFACLSQDIPLKYTDVCGYYVKKYEKIQRTISYILQYRFFKLIFKLSNLEL